MCKILLLKPEKSDLKPAIINSVKNASQARIPTIPVVAVRVVRIPEPELKDTSQKTVPFISAGLYNAQASLNLFGPMPKTGCCRSTPFVTDTVEVKEGFTSLLEIPSFVGNAPPSKPADMKKNRATII